MKARKILVAPAIAGLLVLSACGGGSGGTGDQGGTTESIAPISSQDINIKDRGELAQGGTIRLDVPDFGSNWNPYNVDGNNNDLTRARTPLLPTVLRLRHQGRRDPEPELRRVGGGDQRQPDHGELQAESQGRLG